MYGRRVMKCHPQIDACGALDELNASLGLARAAAPDAARDRIFSIQKELVHLMGELAVAAEDLERYAKDGYARVTTEMTARLEAQVVELETGHPFFSGWATPGANPRSASLDFARAVCRRAERAVAALQQEGRLHNPEVLIYLNRLSDLLWLLARQAESPGPGA